MQLYEMQVTKTAIIRTAPARIPKGIIGAAVRLSFSPEWEGLHKTVVFRAGDMIKDVLDVENEVVIPAECVQEAGALLEVGVYGVDGENTVAIPTLWAAIGRVCEATDPSGDTTTDPSLPVWAQLREMIRQLEEQGVTQNEIDQAVKDYFTANPVTAASIGAAPAGFGLGDAVTVIDSWNNAIKTGFYRAEKDSATGQWMYGYVVNYANNISTQVAFSHSATTLNIALRAGMDGNWQPWGWVNPPLEVGVEYRTTERYNGKPVYTKLVNIGSLPSETTSNVQHGISGITQVIRCIGQNLTNGEPIPSRHNDNYTAIYANDTYIYIYSSFNASDFIGCAQLWYTKN